MSQFKTVERLSLILNYVNQNHYPSLSEIMKHLEDKDLQPTERTLQRDLKTIRDLCFIEIKYDRFNNGYYIDSNSELDFKEWMQVFEVFNRAKVISEILLKNPGSIEYIDFDEPVSNREELLFPSFLKAIIDRQKIKFQYHRYWENEAETIELEPQLLKEYLNRWYIVGTNEQGEFRCYGLERIIEFEISAKTFRAKVKNPKSIFSDVIGLYSENDCEKVVLSYESFQGKYIKSQPLHSSQKILVDNENELRIELFIRPNYELEEQILKQGERVKVIQPTWLRDVIKSRVKKAFENYEP